MNTRKMSANFRNDLISGVFWLLIFLLAIIWILVPSYWYLPKEYFAQQAVLHGNQALEDYAKRKKVPVGSFSGPEIHSGCCLPSPEYRLMYCSKDYGFIYSTDLDTNYEWDITPKNRCDFHSHTL